MMAAILRTVISLIYTFKTISLSKIFKNYTEFSQTNLKKVI